MLVLRSILLATAALALPAMASAQAPGAPPAVAKRVYTPADFARFAPKTAYDMLAQVPSFTIRTTDTSVRGLGQAQENVLINGERIANKSGGAVDQLQRISAGNVERIEVLDAASLGIAGLSGQVANVILKSATTSSGQFEWNPSWRAHYAKPEWLGGSVSYSGKEINAKLVYYGTGLSGKTTNLEAIYEAVPETSRGKVEIRRTDNTLVSTLDIPEFPTLPGATRRLGVPLPLLPKGKYVLLALLDYEGSEIAAGQVDLEIP